MRAMVLLSLSLLTACSSTAVSLPTMPIGPDEEVVGPVSGAAHGFLLFGLVPITHNDRFERAHARALESAPGATRIVDLRIWESWYWAYVGNGFTFHVEGTAVRPRPGSVPPPAAGR